MPGYPHMYYNGENLKPYPTSQVAIKNATLAEVNAGFNVVPARAGFSVAVLDFKIIARGADTAGATSIDLETTESAPTKIAVGLIAAIDNGLAFGPSSTGCTATNIGKELAVGYGVNVVAEGTATGPTTYDIIVDYVFIDTPSMSKPDLS